MKSLRSRLIISHLLPFLVIVPLVGIALLYILETQVVLSDISGDLTAQAELIAQVADTQPGIWRDPAVASTYLASMRIAREIRIYDAAGRLLATSNPQPYDEIGAITLLPAMDEGDKRGYHYFHGFSEVYGMDVSEVLVQAMNGDEVVGVVRVTDRLAAVNNQFDRVRYLVVAVLAVGALLGAAMAFILALNLERPLRRVTTALAGIRTGEQVAPLPIEGPREIRLLSESVNMLLMRLQRVEEARRRLLANLVHELGRPLGALRAAVQALRSGGDLQPDLRAELLEGMDGSIARLSPLLDDLAQLHEQALGQLALDLRTTPMSAWLPTLLPPWRAVARQNELQWLVEIQDDLPALRIDPNRMAQAVGNLVSNSLKYTPTGGTVKIAAFATPGNVLIRVTDNGPGISEIDMPRILDPFYRGQQQKRFPQGLGLGLTIAADIAEAHDGRLDVASRPGEGSQFTIVLPDGTR